MSTLHDIMRDRLLANVYAEEHWQAADAVPVDRAAMEAMQWDSDEWQEVLTLMKNRMSFGGYRYGPTSKQKPRAFDNIKDIHRRLDLHEDTGNMEHLVDSANICIIACLKKDHPNFHFESIDDGEHAKKRIR